MIHGGGLAILWLLLALYSPTLQLTAESHLLITPAFSS